MATVKILGKFSKQPHEVLDYDVDYSAWFRRRTDTPASIEVFAEDGIDLIASALNGNSVKVLLGGGTSGEKYKTTVRLTTAAGLVKEADFTVSIKEV